MPLVSEFIPPAADEGTRAMKILQQVRLEARKLLEQQKTDADEVEEKTHPNGFFGACFKSDQAGLIYGRMKYGETHPLHAMFWA